MKPDTLPADEPAAEATPPVPAAKPTTPAPRKLGTSPNEAAGRPKKHDNNFKQSFGFQGGRGGGQKNTGQKGRSFGRGR